MGGSGGALNIDTGSPAVATQNTGTTLTVTTASFTPIAGSMLYIGWGANTSTANPTTPTITDNLGTHLTYTLLDWQSRADSPTVNGQAAGWWAKVNQAAAMTVTITSGAPSPQGHQAVKIYNLTGVDMNNPIGAHGKAGSSSAASIAQSYTAARTGSMGVINVGDWSATGSMTAGTGCTLVGTGTLGATDVSYGFVRRTLYDGSAGASNTLNVTLAGTSTALAWTYAELIPALGERIVVQQAIQRASDW